MQINGANLLIAAQQAQRQAAAPQPKSFAPLDFKQTTAPQPARAAPAPEQPQRPGATLDIRV